MDDPRRVRHDRPLDRDYDTPIAVLSTLVLGIGVDFAIHFVEHFRELRADRGSTSAAIEAFGEEPARALSRNAAVIAIGFLPLIFSSLTPYVIVGVVLASIIVLSWLATVVALPAPVSGRRSDDLPADEERVTPVSDVSAATRELQPQ